MKKARRAPWLVTLLGFLALVLAPMAAMAGPLSGGSFGGRNGFRSGGGSFSMPRSYSGGGYYNRGYGSPGFVFLPSWGWGGFGYGGGVGLFGTVVVMAVAGLAIASVVRAVRRARGGGGGATWTSDDDDDVGPVSMPGRAYLYKLQLALGRSARGVQDRLAEFAGQGDTSSEAGLAALLQQTSLELLRQRDSVRYAGADARGPMSLTNAETAMNGLTLAERSRFQVERVRAADGRVNRSTAAAEEGKEALELVVVTVVVATRTPLSAFHAVATGEELTALLSELGGVSPDGLLGLEVIWTPADPNDSMTETDVMTTYPDLRSF
jgi:uncharacterized membrane protein